jgi:hypothetical protein
LPQFHAADALTMEQIALNRSLSRWNKHAK